MSISCISDIHVTTSKSKQYAILLNFIKNEKVQNSEKVMFLGDIFDHLTGEHKQYIAKYKEFFSEVAKLLDGGREVFFLEGNHDFHFEKTFTLALHELCKDKEKVANFKYSNSPVKFQFNSKSFTFCHGDDLDTDNKSYQRWKRIYSSNAFGFFVSRVLPYNLVNYLGDKASSDSRERGRAKFNYNREKAKYREAAKSYLNKHATDVLVAGHTHICDKVTWDGKTYVNIGFPQRDQTFLHISKEVIEMISIQ